MIFSVAAATSQGIEGRELGKLLISVEEERLEVLESFAKEDLGFANGFSKQHFLALK